MATGGTSSCGGRASCVRRWVAALALLTAPGPALAQQEVIDLATVSTDEDLLLRVHGYTGDGGLGVPVAGGFDVDGDGNRDFAFASMQASPQPSGESVRTLAGELYLILGDGRVSGSYDTGVADPAILRVIGDGIRETAGSELWMDDVTGDGLGDLLIARQNYTPAAGREGAGALTILVGGAGVRSLATAGTVVDLRSPPVDVTLTTLVGDQANDRLGIWMRTGDITGDGVADIVVGADGVGPNDTHRGAAYVVRGGDHLAAGGTIDLAGIGSTALPGNLARLTPPSDASNTDHWHFGATVALGDLDGNGRAEVLVAAALNRSGASVEPANNPGVTHSNGGTTDGRLFIAWDDNFTDPWPDDFQFTIEAGSGAYTEIDGQTCNIEFGEEILAGLDYDGDGSRDLFVGDIVGNCAPQSRNSAGSGHVFFDAVELKGLEFDLNAMPGNLVRSDIFGGSFGDIAGDTAAHGDFDGDGWDDLAVMSPHDGPDGRNRAGSLHVLYGQDGAWPSQVDLAALPPVEVLRVTEVWGANGAGAASIFDSGDTLGYSAASGDIDGDGHPDLIVNEMVGNGLQPDSEDVGNLIVLSSTLLPEPDPGVLTAAALLGLAFARRLSSRRLSSRSG